MTVEEHHYEVIVAVENGQVNCIYLNAENSASWHEGTVFHEQGEHWTSIDGAAWTAEADEAIEAHLAEKPVGLSRDDLANCTVVVGAVAGSLSAMPALEAIYRHGVGLDDEPNSIGVKLSFMGSRYKVTVTPLAEEPF